jgi:cytochrome-b5 reductase
MMSQYLDWLKIGDKIDVKGPLGKFAYKGKGTYERKVGPAWVPNTVKHFGMVCGGTGITPMYQVIQDILKHPEDKTQVSLIFANVTEDDILLRSELEKLAKTHSNFKVFFTLDKPSEGWTGGSGFVTAEMMKEHLPGPEDSLLMFCGPPPMMNALENNSKKLGFPESGYFIF